MPKRKRYLLVASEVRVAWTGEELCVRRDGVLPVGDIMCASSVDCMGQLSTRNHDRVDFRDAPNTKAHILDTTTARLFRLALSLLSTLLCIFACRLSLLALARDRSA